MSKLVRVASWENVGKDISNVKGYENIINEAGLNFNVVKRKLQFNLCGSKHTIPNKMVTVREDDPNQIFGVVGNNYNICQNVEAFEFINDVEDINFIKAGQTKSGIIYIIGELPEIEVLGDNIKPHIIFSNSHDGFRGIRANICMLRIVCQNQFAASFKDAANAINIKHTNAMNQRLIEAKETMKHTYEYIANYKNMAEKYVSKKVTNEDLQNIIRTMFNVKPEESLDDLNPIKQRRVDYFKDALNSEDNQNFKGTAWGVINAFTDFATHVPTRNKNIELANDNRFIQNTLQSRQLDKFINIVDSIAA